MLYPLCRLHLIRDEVFGKALFLASKKLEDHFSYSGFKEKLRILFDNERRRYIPTLPDVSLEANAENDDEWEDAEEDPYNNPLPGTSGTSAPVGAIVVSETTDKSESDNAIDEPSFNKNRQDYPLNVVPTRLLNENDELICSTPHGRPIAQPRYRLRSGGAAVHHFTRIVEEDENPEDDDESHVSTNNNKRKRDVRT